MKNLCIVMLCVMATFVLACASKMTPDAARSQVNQLITLYEQNRSKFVVQKQEIEQADSCDRATALKQAINEMAEEAAMNPENSDTITKVKMELEQAEKTCLGK